MCLAALGLLVAGWPAAGARAAVAASASVTPAVVAYPGTRELTFRLALAAGNRAELFAVSMEPSSYGYPQGDDYPDEGSPLGPQRTVAVEGPLVLGLAVAAQGLRRAPRP